MEKAFPQILDAAFELEQVSSASVDAELASLQLVLTGGGGMGDTIL